MGIVIGLTGHEGTTTPHPSRGNREAQYAHVSRPARWLPTIQLPCYCPGMIAGPLPFRGPSPGRDAWALGQSIPFNPAKWRGQLPSPAWWPLELDALPVHDHAHWPMVDRRTVFHVAERAAEPVGADNPVIAADLVSCAG